MTEAYPFPWKFEAHRYPSAYLMQRNTEDQVQRSILDLLALYKIDAIAIDAGARRQRGRMMGAWKKSGLELSAVHAGISNVKIWYSMPAGFSDLAGTLAPDGRSLYIEVKAPAQVDTKGRIVKRAGVPSEDQLAFLLSKHKRGAIVLVAWSSLDVEHHLKQRLHWNKDACR